MGAGSGPSFGAGGMPQQKVFNNFLLVISGNMKGIQKAKKSIDPTQ